MPKLQSNTFNILIYPL